MASVRDPAASSHAAKCLRTGRRGDTHSSTTTHAQCTICAIANNSWQRRLLLLPKPWMQAPPQRQISPPRPPSPYMRKSLQRYWAFTSTACPCGSADTEPPPLKLCASHIESLLCNTADSNACIAHVTFETLLGLTPAKSCREEFVTLEPTIIDLCFILCCMYLHRPRCKRP